MEIHQPRIGDSPQSGISFIAIPLKAEPLDEGGAARTVVGVSNGGVDCGKDDAGD